MLKYSLNRCKIIDYFEWVLEYMSVRKDIMCVRADHLKNKTVVKSKSVVATASQVVIAKR